MFALAPDHMSSFIIHDVTVVTISVTVATISPVDQAQNQMSSMWKQLESLHKTIDGGSQVILNFFVKFFPRLWFVYRVLHLSATGSAHGDVTH